MMYQSPSDEELMAGVVNGHKAMFEELVQRYEQRLFGFICRLTANEADAPDLFQETFLKVYAKASKFRGEGSFRSWLYAIAANLCRSHAAKRARLVVTDPADFSDRANGSPLPGPSLAADAIGRRIATAVTDLPSEQREVFVLKAYEEMSYPEIAATLGRPVGTVKSQMRYALEKMRVLLHDLAEAEGVV